MGKRIILSPLVAVILLLGGYEIYTSTKGRELLTAAHIVEGLNLATAIKTQIAEYYFTQGDFPDTNADLGLPSPRSLHGRSVKSIEVSLGGKITVVYNNALKKDSSLTLTPTIPAEYSLQPIEWVCTTESIDQSVFESISVPCFYVPPGLSSELMEAIVTANEAQVRSVIDQGGDVNAVLHGDSPLLVAIGRDRFAIAQQLLAAGADVNQKAINYHGMSPLMYAASLGRKALSILLLEHGADVNSTDDIGKTALMYAAAKGRKDVVELLLARGANPILKDKRGRDAIRYAKKDRRHSDIHALIKTAQVNFSTIQQQQGHAQDASDLMRAAARGDVAAIHQLLQEGSSIGTVDSQNATALHYAVAARQASAVAALVKAGIDVNIVDRDGSSPLLLAVKNDAVQIAKLLLQHGAEVNVMDRYQNTPLLMAIRFGYQDLVALLLSSGAKDSASKALYESFLSSASNQAVRSIQVLIIASSLVLDQDEKVIASLLRKAIKVGHIRLVRYLLEKGGSLEAGAHGFPLHYAAQQGKDEICRLLVSHGLDINAVDEEGKTALMFAVESGQLRLVRYLLDVGADVDVMDKNGLTALRMAKANYAEDIAELLREYKK